MTAIKGAPGSPKSLGGGVLLVGVAVSVDVSGVLVAVVGCVGVVTRAIQ